MGVDDGPPGMADTLGRGDVAPGQAAEDIEEHIVGEADVVAVAGGIHGDGSVTDSRQTWEEQSDSIHADEGYMGCEELRFVQFLFSGSGPNLASTASTIYLSTTL